MCHNTSLINSSALLSINNATTVVNGTYLQSVADHTKHHHSLKIVIIILSELQHNSKTKSNRVNELDTILNAPEDTFCCETVGDVFQKGEIFTTPHLEHGSGQFKLIMDTGAKCIVTPAQQLHIIVP